MGKRTSSKVSKQQARRKAEQETALRADRLEHRMSQARGAPASVRAAAFGDAVVFARSPKGRRLERWDLPELLEELSRALAELGRTDEALAVAQEAIEEGLEGEPDPRCVLAEINYRAGRREAAEAIWAQVRADTPDDVWLFTSVGMEKHYGGEHEQAIEWLGRGLEVAQDQGDPERLVDQLLDFRAGSLRALGRDDDDTQRQANAYRLANAARRMTSRRSSSTAPPSCAAASPAPRPNRGRSPRPGWGPGTPRSCAGGASAALVVDEATLVPVVVPLAPAKTLLERLPDAIAEVLGAHQVPAKVVEAERAAMSPVRLAPTANRSVVGVMTELVYLAGPGTWSQQELLDLSLQLSTTPLGPLYKRHLSPDRELAALVAARSR